MSQTTAFDVIRVIGKIDLRFVVDTTFQFHLFLFAQHSKQRHNLRFRLFL